MIENINEFQKFLEKYKAFRELPEQYKSTKFIVLYSKMYKYMLSIPKEKIVVDIIKKYNRVVQCLFYYIFCFIEVKDFYNWKERTYNLVTEKLSSTSKRKYELLYGFKAEEFYSKYQRKCENTCMKNLGVKHPSQSNKIKEKKKATCMKNLGVENPAQSNEVQDKIKATCLERYGKEYYAQTEECKEKMKAIYLEIYGVENPMQSLEIQEKAKATRLDKYGKESYSQTEEFKEKTSSTWKNKTKEELKQIKEKKKETCKQNNNGIEYGFLKGNGGHSKIADDMCKALDILYNTLESENTKYFTKNGEFSLSTEDNHNFYYDYTNIIEKWIVEFQGLYSHGLLEGQEYVFGRPVEEIHRKDKEKRILAEQNSYKVFYVYENEYKSNKFKCLENLLKEIKEYVHSKENRI